jgi:putative hemolysin
MILGAGARTFGAQKLLPATMSWLPHPGQIVRELHGLPDSLGRLGSLEIRLATRKKDIRKAQKLRFKVFYEEGDAIADRRSALTRRDICRFDRICDHLLVIDHDAKTRLGRRKPKVVGAYRLLRQDVAERHGGFYTAGEYDIAPLLARHRGKRFLELGRSCVHKDWRSRKTLELMWRGIWTYVRHHRIDVMIGCASLPGANPLAHALALSFLHHHASAADHWQAHALSGRGVPMDMLRADVIDRRRALDAMPPLVKGYLRVGAKFGAGAVVDRQFGTTDVLVVMPVADIDPRYVSYFTAAAPMDGLAA